MNDSEKLQHLQEWMGLKDGEIPIALSVGTGDANLFVYGSLEAISLVQEILMKYSLIKEDGRTCESNQGEVSQT